MADVQPALSVPAEETVPAARRAHRARDRRLDALRGVALLAIVMSHVGPPSWVQQLRSFDVPLVVLVAGAASSLSLGRAHRSYLRYVLDRLLRLVAPTWVFLTFFFLVTPLAARLLHRPFPFSLRQVAETYVLLDGIGYVWIIRVFLLVALIAPATLAGFERLGKRRVLALLVVVYIAYEAMVAIARASAPGPLVGQLLFYLLPYGVVAGIGMVVFAAPARWRLTAAVVILAIWAAAYWYLFTVHGHVVPAYDSKYPPTVYYLGYGLGVSLLLSVLADRLDLDGKAWAWLSWVGRHTMWLYLWHIPVAYLSHEIGLPIGFLGWYAAAVAVPVGIVAVQDRLLHAVVLPRVTHPEARKRLAVVFGG